jgi:hypothetical protein
MLYYIYPCYTIEHHSSIISFNRIGQPLYSFPYNGKSNRLILSLNREPHYWVDYETNLCLCCGTEKWGLP